MSNSRPDLRLFPCQFEFAEIFIEFLQHFLKRYSPPSGEVRHAFFESLKPANWRFFRSIVHGLIVSFRQPGSIGSTIQRNDDGLDGNQGGSC